MLDDIVRKGRLLDVYGPLLTERQRRCMEMYFEMDLSLSEIGEELGISRQGAYDMLRRASNSLEEYEQRLRFLARSDRARAELDKVGALLEQGGPEQLAAARRILKTIEL